MDGNTRIKPATKQNARKLRREMTDVEQLLWRQLRGKQIGGFKFRRQHPLGRYIADFACVEACLVVEIDGGQHLENVEDDARTRWMENTGFRVLRFWNHEVLNNIEEVKLVIWNSLQGN